MLTDGSGTTHNWKDLKKRGDDATKPAEPGWYVVECVKAEVKKASTTGNPMISAQFKIAEGPAAGKTVFTNFNVTPDSDFALGIFFNQLAAFGLDDAFFATDPSIEQLAASLVTRKANVELGIRAWQGVDRNEFKNVRRLDGQVPAGQPVAAGIPSATGPSAATPTAAPTGDGVPRPPAF
jgi:hypothetical protein